MTEELASRLAIQTYTFRAIPEHAGVIAGLKTCGVNTVEMCDCHLDAADENRLQVLELYRKSGISIAAYGVHLFTGDEQSSRPLFEFGREAGYSLISGDVAEGGLEVAEELCAEYGMRLGIHNHGREHTLGSIEQLDELFGKSSPNIGLWLDTGWMLDSGEDPVKAAVHFEERLYGVHLKDMTFDADGKLEDAVVGTGRLDLGGFMQYLVETGFSGPVAVEYEGDEDDPVPATVQCISAIRAALAECS